MTSRVPEESWQKLLADTLPEIAHPVERWALGEYAVLQQRQGPDAAAARFPEIAAHLAAGCADCAVTLAELHAFAIHQQQLTEVVERERLSQPIGAEPLPADL